MELLTDGFRGLDGGMNSALSPQLIPANQYHVGFNITSRSGQVSTRPAFGLAAPAISNYRGGVMFTHGNGESSLVVVSGTSVLTMNSSSSTANSFTQIPGVALLSNSGPVYFCAVGAYLVIQDGVNRAIVIRSGNTPGLAWTTTNYGLTIPIGTHMAYGHSRIFVVAPAGAVAPALQVNMKETGIVCTVPSSGLGYNSGKTQTFTQATPATQPRVFPRMFGDGLPSTGQVPASYSVEIRDGRIVNLTIGGDFLKLPEIKFITTNESNTEVTDGSLGSGATAVASFVPTEVESITVTGGGGYSLTPTVRFDNSGTGGSGAEFTASLPGGTLQLAKVSGGSGYKRPPRVILENLGGPTQEVFASDIAYGGSEDTFDIDESFPISGGTVVLMNQIVPFSAGEPVTIDSHSSFPSINGTWAVSNVGVVPTEKRGVERIAIIENGEGYSSPPTVTIDPPPEGGRRAKAVSVLQATIVGVTIRDRGTGYDYDACDGGRKLVLELEDQWLTTTENPVFDVRLGEGRTSATKVRRDQIEQVTVLDGGGPYETSTQGRPRQYQSNWDETFSNAYWEPEPSATRPNAGWFRRTTDVGLPVPPVLRVRDNTSDGVSSGVKAEAVVVNGLTYWRYPRKVIEEAGTREVQTEHARFSTQVKQVVSSIVITDSGDGYRVAPDVEISGGGRATVVATAQAILGDATTRNPFAFTIPALTSTNGIGGRVRRANAGKFEDIFQFTESSYLYEGGGYNLSGFVGRITGIFFLPVANNTSGRGDLGVLGTRGAVTLAVSNPRTDWKEIAFVRVILTETGAVSDGAFTVAQGDAFFYSSEGLRSYRNAMTGEVDGSVTPLDVELYGVLGLGKKATRSRLVYFDNRLMFLAAESPPNQYRAMGVLDWASSYTGAQSAKPAWDGFWFAPGADPRGSSVNVFFQDILASKEHLFLICSNGVYRMSPDFSGDRLTTGPAETAIPWVMETRAIDFDNSGITKRLLRASVWVQDAKGTNTFSLRHRTENKPNWTSWIDGQEYTSTATGGYAYRMDIPFPVESSENTGAEFRVGLDRGQSFQFRVQGTGRLRFVKFLFYALQVVESQYGIAKTTTAITITPTGVSETYPI